MGYSAGLVLHIVLGIMDDLKPHPSLTAADREARRRLAIRKVLDGRTQADVADFLGVHPVTVAKWMAAYRAGGEEALTAKPVPGRPRFLSDDQEAEVRSWLLKKPTEFGFRTDLWTAARVAQLIREPQAAAYRGPHSRATPSTGAIFRTAKMFPGWHGAGSRSASSPNHHLPP